MPLYLFTRVEGRSAAGAIPQELFTLFFEIGSLHWDLGLADLASMPPEPLSVPAQHQHTSFLYKSLGIELKTSHLHKHFSAWLSPQPL